MKIVLLSMNFAPELTGIGKYSGEMADALVARGHEVTVVCAPPYYPAWTVQGPWSARRYSRETPRPGLTVIRCPLWLPRRLSGLSRLLCLASFALSSFPVLMRLVGWRPDVVFVVVPALFCAPAGWLTARLAGARAWLHVQDLEVDAAYELGLLKGGLVRGLVQGAERRLMRGFDVVSTISRRMLRQLAGKGVALDQTELLPNWVDIEAIRPVDRSPALRAELGLRADQTVCLFSGTINRKQGLGALVEAAALLHAQGREDVVIVISGNGELRQGLEQQAAALGLPNLRFCDLRPLDELNALLNMADIHLLPQVRGAADLVMPSKLAGMLASGRPVVAAVQPGTEIAATLEGRGLVTEPECPQGLAEAILRLAADPALRERLGAAGRRHAEAHLDAEVLFDRLERRLDVAGRQLPAPEVVVEPAPVKLAA